MGKRYQVFVSSTFDDLQNEREKVFQALWRARYIPAGMEMFTASGMPPWDLIRPVILESDYYVVIVGGRYGSVTETGLSFTETEYNFAVESKISTLAFLHGDPEALPAKYVQFDALPRLQAFRATLRHRHHVMSWHNADELAGNVITSLAQEIVAKPGLGWVRSHADNRAGQGLFLIPMDPWRGAEIVVRGTFRLIGQYQRWSTTLSIREAFYQLSLILRQAKSDEQMRAHLAKVLADTEVGIAPEATIDTPSLKVLTAPLLKTGLIANYDADGEHGIVAYWELTKTGKKLSEVLERTVGEWRGGA